MNDKLERSKTTIDPAEGQVEIGQWYWVGPHAGEVTESEDGDDIGDKEPWFGCVTHVGSNYVEVTDPIGGGSTRIHFDNYWTEMTYEPHPEDVIEGRLRHHQQRADELMGRVQQLTALLAVTPNPALHHAGAETAALALCMEGQSYDEYKASLVKAHDKELPALFEEIKETHAALAGWMSARVVPMKARFKELREVISLVENRIFTVQLYAGLVEEIEQIADGAPAELTEKIHLLQRRHYMDEECLAAYETGGMEFKDLRAFERWLIKPKNRDRILPFPRCVVAFRVRRQDKERRAASIADFIHIFHLQNEDKQTFLYIRNGKQIYRLQTAIKFGSKLFPDTERSRLHGKLWAYDAWGHLDAERIISDNEYKGRVEEYNAKLAKIKEERRQWKRLSKQEREGKCEPSFSFWHIENPTQRYSPFDKTNLHFDDIAKVLSKEVQKHNRIALVIQGLLDRSPILHPHPPWRLWTQEGYEQALVLIYDETRALATGDAPDFESYRARLNAQLRTGSVTVGQQVLWERREAEKLYERSSHRSQYRPERYAPYGNPGPGDLAEIAHYAPRSARCTYRWDRQRVWRSRDARIPTTFTCPAKGILNVSAYTPGDFHMFFDDPRTRADYLGWAPLLLAAEEYHAGNRKVGPVEE